MARQQRDMMITSQAAQMTADATQHKMQIDMQNKAPQDQKKKPTGS